MEERMAVLVAEAEVNRAHLESSAGILGQQQQLEEAARKQVCHNSCISYEGPFSRAVAS